MRIKLREKRLHRQESECKHERLIAIVAGTEVPLAECISKRQLRCFLAVTEDTKLGAAGRHLAAPKRTDMPAPASHAVVPQHSLGVPAPSPLIFAKWTI